MNILNRTSGSMNRKGDQKVRGLARYFSDWILKFSRFLFRLLFTSVNMYIQMKDTEYLNLNT